MKKKMLIAILIIIAVVIGTMYLIDRNRMKNNEPVIFSTWGTKYAPPAKEDFEITVVEAENQGAKKILNNQEINKNNSSYDLYYYNLSEVNVKVDGRTMTLEEALRSGKITLDRIISKAKADFPDNLHYYSDGGSEEYHYENYTIIKLHNLDGNRDVYIAKKGTILRDLNI